MASDASQDLATSMLHAYLCDFTHYTQLGRSRRLQKPDAPDCQELAMVCQLPVLLCKHQRPGAAPSNVRWPL